LLSGTLGFLSAYVENPSIFDDFDENGNPVKHANSSLPGSPNPYECDEGGGGPDPTSPKAKPGIERAVRYFFI
jgi:hypothetical protein